MLLIWFAGIGYPPESAWISPSRGGFAFRSKKLPGTDGKKEESSKEKETRAAACTPCCRGKSQTCAGWRFWEG
jgi:hypothetical protein